MIAPTHARSTITLRLKNAELHFHGLVDAECVLWVLVWVCKITFTISNSLLYMHDMKDFSDRGNNVQLVYR